MDCLFVAINARYIHTNNAVRLLHANTSFTSAYVEYTIKDAPAHIYEDMVSRNPAVIGFSVYLWNVNIVVELTRKIKRKTGIRVILGGPEVSYDAVHYLKTSRADMVVKGEGEAIIDDVLTALLNHALPTDLSNAAYGHSGLIYDNPVTKTPDVSRLKSPHRFDADARERPHKIAYIEASRGCPYRCSFCLSSLEKGVRFFPAKTVLADIEHLLKTHARVIKFLDRTFNAHPDAKTIIEGIIERHRGQAVFQFEITADILDRDIIETIHSTAPKNMFRFEIGIQTLCEETNRLIDRKQDNKTLLTNIVSLIDADIIDLHLDLIAGLPSEHLASFKETFNTVYRLGAKELQLGFLKLLRGTKIREEAALYMYRYNDAPPYEIMENYALTTSDIQTLKRVESALNIFHNTPHFDDAFKRAIAASESPFAFFENLYDALIKQKTPLPAYQIIDLYRAAVTVLKQRYARDETIDALAIGYLMRAKTKPKPYFETLDAAANPACFSALTNSTPFSESDFHRRAIAIKTQTGVFVALYKHFKAHGFFWDEHAGVRAYKNGPR